MNKILWIILILVIVGCGIYYYIGYVTTPVIGKLSPLSGSVGASVAITGSGFSRTGNKVFFDGLVDETVPSDGKTLTFIVNNMLSPDCSNNQPCPNFIAKTGVRSYNVTVKNSHGVESNSIGFAVTAINPDIK